jgi:hypothetical protein
LDDIEPFVAPF